MGTPRAERGRGAGGLREIGGGGSLPSSRDSVSLPRTMITNLSASRLLRTLTATSSSSSCGPAESMAAGGSPPLRRLTGGRSSPRPTVIGLHSRGCNQSSNQYVGWLLPCPADLADPYCLVSEPATTTFRPYHRCIHQPPPSRGAVFFIYR